MAMKLYFIGDITEKTVKSVYDSIMNNYNVGEDVELVFDTHGGYVSSAYEIIELLNELKGNGSKLIASNTGNVMSCATLIWLNCDKRIWNDSVGNFLIHNPYIEKLTGDAETMIEGAAELIRYESDFKRIYSDISGCPEDEFTDVMKRNRRLTYDELVKYKFITHRASSKRKYAKQQ